MSLTGYEYFNNKLSTVFIDKTYKLEVSKYLLQIDITQQLVLIMIKMIIYW